MPSAKAVPEPGVPVGTFTLDGVIFWLVRYGGIDWIYAEGGREGLLGKGMRGYAYPVPVETPYRMGAVPGPRIGRYCGVLDLGGLEVHADKLEVRSDVHLPSVALPHGLPPARVIGVEAAKFLRRVLFDDPGEDDEDGAENDEDDESGAIMDAVMVWNKPPEPLNPEIPTPKETPMATSPNTPAPFSAFLDMAFTASKEGFKAGTSAAVTRQIANFALARWGHHLPPILLGSPLTRAAVELFLPPALLGVTFIAEDKIPQVERVRSVLSYAIKGAVTIHIVGIVDEVVPFLLMLMKDVDSIVPVEQGEKKEGEKKEGEKKEEDAGKKPGKAKKVEEGQPG